MFLSGWVDLIGILTIDISNKLENSAFFAILRTDQYRVYLLYIHVYTDTSQLYRDYNQPFEGSCKQISTMDCHKGLNVAHILFAHLVRH